MTEPNNIILHITTKNDWQTAQEKNEYWAKSLETEGFIHCSRPEQLITTANRFFRGSSDLLVLCINRSKVKNEIRDENADNDVFPHIYGCLNLDAIIQAVPFPPQEDGTFVVPQELQNCQ